MNIGLIGPQGCGKSSLAIKLAQRYNLFHFEIGEFIRQQAYDTDKQAPLIDHLINHKGRLLPDGIVIDLVLSKLSQLDANNIIFDGFPRTVNQYQCLSDHFLQHRLNLSAIFFLSIPDEISISRSFHRHRQDDNPQALQNRLKDYHQSNDPLLEILRTDHKLIEIDATQTLEEVFMQIIKHADRFTRFNFSQ